MSRWRPLPLVAVIFVESIVESSIESSGLALAQTSAPETPALRTLAAGKDYFLLIDDYQEIKRLSALVGFSGEYGHIEFVRAGRAYGCRPPRCAEISLTELERRFSGRKFAVREVERGDYQTNEHQTKDNQTKAIRWFKQNLEGKVYDLLYRNCTDAVIGMYEAAGQRARSLNPVEVERTYATNEPLRRFMAEQKIPKPKRAGVYFPDQFTALGKYVSQGRFRKR